MATEHDLKLAVDFGGVSIGDATASIGVTVDRKDLDLATADEYFSGKRLEGQIRISNRNDDQPKLFDPGVEPPSVATTFDVKRYGVNAKHVSLRLTFALDTIGVGDLSHFAKRSGWLEVDNLGEIPQSEEEDAIYFVSGPPQRTLGGIDKGGSMHLRSLERSELKALPDREIFVDGFAGGGGASVGIEAALGRQVDVGIVTIGGEPYQIVDIGMRMLTPRELFRAQGFPRRLRTTHEQFAAAAKETRIWLWRRKSQTKDTCLDYKGWDRLKAAAVELADLLQGLRIDQAVEVMLTRVRCNAFLLQGMTQKHRFWEHPKSEVLQ